MTLEKSVQAEICDWLRLHRPEIAWKRFPMGQGQFGSRSRHSAGASDLIGVLPGGRGLLVEVKRPGARPRANEAKQREFLEAARKLGALVVVAHSPGELEAALVAEGY